MDKRLLCKLHLLLGQLNQGRDTLAAMKEDCSMEEWQCEVTKIMPQKVEAQEIVGRFTEDYIKGMTQRVKNRKKLRLRKRRQLESAKEEEEAMMRRRSQKHKTIDEHRSAESKAEQERKQDGELQKEIDNTLSEVRRKKKEMSQQQNLHRALRKLRQIRHSENRVTVTAEDHGRFEQGMKQVEEFVQQRSLMYREEERTMQVMLEGERDEQQALEDERTRRKRARTEAATLKKNRDILFGEDPGGSEGGLPINPFYQRGAENLQAFIEIRKQWDVHLTANSSEGSMVPLGWVAPVPPSSNKWKIALSDVQ